MRPRRPSTGRRSRRKTRYFSPYHQRSSRAPRGRRGALLPEDLMSDGASLGVAISFTAGLLSFLSPCVLPLIPSYVTFVTGLSLEDVQRSRRVALVHSLLFVLGFTLIFLALGATATTLGRLLGYNRDWIGRIGGVLVILLGLYLLGVFNFGALARERRVHIADKPVGYLGT